MRNYVFAFENKFSWWKVYGTYVWGISIGLAAFAAFVYYDKNCNPPYRPDHHEAENRYKLLYQLKDNKSQHH